jgi:hypothetical protein
VESFIEVMNGGLMESPGFGCRDSGGGEGDPRFECWLRRHRYSFGVCQLSCYTDHAKKDKVTRDGGVLPRPSKNGQQKTGAGREKS